MCPTVQDEFISARALQILAQYCRGSYLSASVCRSTLRTLAPLLCYPSDVIKYGMSLFFSSLEYNSNSCISGVVNFIHAYAKKFDMVESQCHIPSEIEKYASIEPMLDTPQNILLSLKDPVSLLQREPFLGAFCRRVWPHIPGFYISSDNFNTAWCGEGGSADEWRARERRGTSIRPH